jgi:hypothetical protein
VALHHATPLKYSTIHSPYAYGADDVSFVVHHLSCTPPLLFFCSFKEQAVHNIVIQHGIILVTLRPCTPYSVLHMCF